MDVSAAAEYVTQLSGSGLVFVHLRADAEALYQALLGRGVAVDWVTGDRSVSVREKIAGRLRTGALAAVVATDAWSAGIDIPELRWVAIEAWSSAPVGVLQRAGRGSRLAPGKASFVVHLLPGNHQAKARAVLETRGYQLAPAIAEFSIEELRQPKPPGSGSRAPRQRMVESLAASGALQSSVAANQQAFRVMTIAVVIAFILLGLIGKACC